MGLIYLWCWTIPARRIDPGKEDFARHLPGRHILTLWHGRIFYLFYYLRRNPQYHLLISPSKDGDWLARLSRWMGYSVIRGSSYKKAVPAARSLIRILRRDLPIIIIADGSRGPRCKAQPGSLQLAAITGAPVIPMTFGARNKKTLNSWDRFVIPYPFNPCAVQFGSPIDVPPEVDEETLKQKQMELEESLNALCQQCDEA
ncbi:MAG: hypothetical protein COV67_06905 [Nitrospinae bacterium CG11_big_fil_rev_8_21_14_0_20_56_8]|nr:MAG: hypothetical protein COV67_06905 [Nitrospinae bacterium CG11_big_fil_rev_8_21_14_0_20_56_8]